MLVKTKYLILISCLFIFSCWRRDDVPNKIPGKYRDYNAPYYPLMHRTPGYRYHYNYPYDNYNSYYYESDDQYNTPLRKYDDNFDSNRDRAIN